MRSARRALPAFAAPLIVCQYLEIEELAQIALDHYLRLLSVANFRSQMCGELWEAHEPVREALLG
jgi:hypothetical protein